MGQLLRKARKLLRLMPEKEWRRGLPFGVAAAVEHQHALSKLNFAQIVDVGANKGQFSLFCRARFPNAKIVAFEPLANPAGTFRAVFRNMPSVSLIEAAIANFDGKATMHVSAREDSSSLLSITKRQADIFPGTEEIATTEIQAGRLDTYLPRHEIELPALLKIDVQGFELDVLKGSESLLDCFDNIYVECSFVELYAGQALAPDIIDWLRERDFRLSGQFNEAVNPEMGLVQADLLFERTAN